MRGQPLPGFMLLRILLQDRFRRRRLLRAARKNAAAPTQDQDLDQGTDEIDPGAGQEIEEDPGQDPVRKARRVR